MPETISDNSIERVRKLGGGIAIQNRMAFQGEYFLDRYGKEQILRSPPINKILAAGIPVGMGTDGTRVSSYNPWLCLYWLVSGKTVGGTKIYDDSNIISREKAIELYTKGSAWFSNEQDKKGSFIANQLADFAVLSKDFFQVPEEEIKDMFSVMTVVGGTIVHASDEFASMNPPLPEVSPDWSPIKRFGTYGQNKLILSKAAMQQHSIAHHFHSMSHGSGHKSDPYPKRHGFDFGCLCYAF